MLRTSWMLLLLTAGYHLGKAQRVPVCGPVKSDVCIYEGETARLKVKCDKVVNETVTGGIFCSSAGPGAPAIPGVDTDKLFYMYTITKKKTTWNLVAIDDGTLEGDEEMKCQLLPGRGFAVTGQWDITIKECPAGEKWQLGNGATCDAPSTAAPKGGCWKCPHPQVWHADTAECLESASCCPQPCSTGLKWQKGDGKTCANLKPADGIKCGCFPCPLGQIYNDIGGNCIADENLCQKGIGSGSGDPHYTTFDGTYYTIFPTGKFIVSEDAEGGTWKVCQTASNRCSGGHSPTCSDGISVKFNTTILGTKVTFRISYDLWTNMYVFDGPTPPAEDAVITHSGYSFTVHLPKHGVTVQQSGYLVTVILSAKWYGTGQVHGFLGDWDGNRANDIALPDGTVIDFNSINYTYAYACQPILPPPPPIPPTCDPGPRKDAAEALCSVLHSNPGPYTKCHDKYPPGNTYELPIDTPYEQCVYDNCIIAIDDNTNSDVPGCSNILAYANQCKKDQCNIGDPPKACQPTCPAGKVYKACGPLVGPSCDNPDGVDGNTEGCYCPDGQLLTRSGDCVTTCPCTAYFERNEILTTEESGGFCMKLTRPGTTTTECPVTVTLDKQLSADATGTPAGDTCCGLKCPNTPVVCGGTTQCQITIQAGETEGCMWVKVDSDDTTEDRAVMLTIPDDRARVTIKSALSENCFSFGDRIGFVDSSAKVSQIQLSLASPAPQDACVTVSTIDGSAKACAQYQGGKYKGCFEINSTSTSIFIPGLVKGKGYSCFYTTAAACEGEPELEMCKYKYGFHFVAAKSSKLPKNGTKKQECYSRTPTVDEMCSKKRTVVRITILEELMPDECYVGYKAKIMKVYQGDLTVGEEATVWILPLSDCPDPDLSYGKDYVFAGSVDKEKLVVEKSAFLSTCDDFEDIEGDLCP